MRKLCRIQDSVAKIITIISWLITLYPFFKISIDYLLEKESNLKSALSIYKSFMSGQPQHQKLCWNYANHSLTQQDLLINYSKHLELRLKVVRKPFLLPFKIRNSFSFRPTLQFTVHFQKAPLSTGLLSMVCIAVCHLLNSLALISLALNLMDKLWESSIDFHVYQKQRYKRASSVLS